MTINALLEKKGITKYRLAKQSGVPHATLNDLCSGKTSIGKCSSETLYRIARVLEFSMEMMINALVFLEKTRAIDIILICNKFIGGKYG